MGQVRVGRLVGHRADGGGGSTASRVIGVGVALFLVVVVAGVAWAAETHDVEVVDDAFSPASITITEGDTVRWTQTGSNPHTVTADDESWDSHEGCQTFADAADGECMQQGETYQRQFDEPGEYGYFCRLHGSPGAGMAGTIVVEAAAEEEASPEEDAPEEEAPPEEDAPAEDDDVDETEELPETGAGVAALVVGGLLALAAGAYYLRRREV